MTIGDEVSVVVEVREKSSYDSGTYCDGYTVTYGRVLSLGEGVIAVWPDDGNRPLFAPASDVFLDSDEARKESRVRELREFPDHTWIQV